MPRRRVWDRNWHNRYRLWCWAQALTRSPQEIAAYDLAKVLYANDAKLADYTPDAYTAAMEQIVRSSDPQFVIMPHTYLVRDYAPKLAARFGKSLISDCVRAKVASGSVTFTRRIFLGKIDADVVSDGEAPIFATFQSGAYRGDQAVKGSGAPWTQSRSKSARYE